MFKRLLVIAVLSSLTIVAQARNITINPSLCYNRATFAQNTWQGLAKGQSVEQALAFAEQFQNSADDGTWGAVRVARHDASNINQNRQAYTMQSVYQVYLQDCLANIGKPIDLY